MGTRIVVMKDGVISKWIAAQIYDEPKTLRRRFWGSP
jgi:hypothetical protein